MNLKFQLSSNQKSLPLYRAEKWPISMKIYDHFTWPGVDHLKNKDAHCFWISQHLYLCIHVMILLSQFLIWGIQVTRKIMIIYGILWQVYFKMYYAEINMGLQLWWVQVFGFIKIWLNNRHASDTQGRRDEKAQSEDSCKNLHRNIFKIMMVSHYMSWLWVFTR